MADKDNENNDVSTDENVDTENTTSDDSQANETSDVLKESVEAGPEAAPLEDGVQKEETEEPAEEVEATSSEEAEVEAAPITTDEKTPAQIIESFEAGQLKDDIPSFRPGDTVVVSVKVREGCLLYTSPSPRDATLSRMPSSA